MVNCPFALQAKGKTLNQIILPGDFTDPVQTGFPDTAALAPTLQGVQAKRRAARLLKIRHGMKARQQRERYFQGKLFSDPAWDILLELYAASLADRRLTVSRLADRTGVAMTTALRWINTLQQEGLLDRQDHPLDGRQVYHFLSEAGLQVMDSYFDDLSPETELF
jgi:DNA-binding MarR family transcriptional regulator